MCKMLNENGITPRKSQIEEEEEDEEEEKTLRVYTLHSKIENYAMRVNNTVSAIHTNRISCESTGRNGGS